MMCNLINIFFKYYLNKLYYIAIIKFYKFIVIYSNCKLNYMIADSWPCHIIICIIIYIH